MENGLSHYNYHQVYLRVKLFEAEGIDEPNPHASMVNKDYWVVLWVRPDEEYRTKSVTAFTNPVWNTEGTFFIREYPSNKAFLHLEVLRFNPVNDPGTSSRIVVVGRARIPFPKKFDSEKKKAL
ncbi:C2 domain [Sesbania bispinosa]|nr:C2 domain [Sesbania bispinosa]